MEKQMQQVRDFHRHIGAGESDTPRMLSTQSDAAGQLAATLRGVIADWNSRDRHPDQLVERSLMSIEELAEWLEAHVENDLTAVADAWGDRCYLLMGDASETGLPVEQIFDAVHESNMTKARQKTRRGKALKEDGFATPGIDLGTVCQDSTD